MITIQNLKSLKFKITESPFTNKLEWTVGKEDIEAFGKFLGKNPIIYYDIDSQIAKTIRGEFTIISRKCDTEQELKKFSESIKFLFNISDVMLPL